MQGIKQLEINRFTGLQFLCH